jgi:tRNA pseudouridine65 synthase
MTLGALPILVDDPAFVIVDKPSGLSVHKGWDKDPDNAMKRVKHQLGRWVWPVHRLDRGTSGCLLFALDEEAARHFGTAFSEHRVEKVYVALVRGTPNDVFEVDHPLPRSEDDQERVPARTSFRRLSSSPEGRYSLLEARPHSGRLHQIRRHLRHVRHPICADSNWGDNKLNKVVRALGLNRMALHALELQVDHPVSGEKVRARAPLPPDLATILETLGVPVDARMLAPASSR